MNAFQEFLSRCKTLAWGMLIGFTIFFSCFSFPILNVTKEWPPEFSLVSWINLCVCISAYYKMGEIFAVLASRTFHAVLLALALTCAGFGCRYLLEFGEVSNTYNFTWPNAALHLAAATALTLTGRRRALLRTQ